MTSLPALLANLPNQACCLVVLFHFCETIWLELSTSLWYLWMWHFTLLSWIATSYKFNCFKNDPNLTSGATTFSITTLSITIKNATFSMLILDIVMQSLVMLSVIYAACHCGKCMRNVVASFNVPERPSIILCSISLTLWSFFLFLFSPPSRNSSKFPV